MSFKDKKLYKSTNKMVDGVCAGIAEYFDIDPTLIRVAYAVISLFLAGFGGIILYVVLAIVIPRRPASDYQYNQYQQGQPPYNNDSNQ